MKLKAFCKKHLGEVSFALWTIFMVVFTFLGLKSYPTAFVCAFVGGVAFVGNVILSGYFSFGVRTGSDCDRLKCSSMLATIVMAIMITASDVVEFLTLYTLIGMLLCIATCNWIINKWSLLNRKLEILRTNDYENYLREKVNNSRTLDEDEEIDLLHLPDAVPFVKKYIQNGRLWADAESEFLEDRKFAGLWEDYFKLYNLSCEEELKLFNRSDAKEIIALYSSYSQMSERAELKLFSMPDAEEWVKMYIEKGAFYGEASELKLFEMPNAEELVKFYASKYAFYDPAYKLAKEKGWL